MAISTTSRAGASWPAGQGGPGSHGAARFAGGGSISSRQVAGVAQPVKKITRHRHSAKLQLTGSRAPDGRSKHVVQSIQGLPELRATGDPLRFPCRALFIHQSTLLSRQRRSTALCRIPLHLHMASTKTPTAEAGRRQCAGTNQDPHVHGYSLHVGMRRKHPDPIGA